MCTAMHRAVPLRTLVPRKRQFLRKARRVAGGNVPGRFAATGRQFFRIYAASGLILLLAGIVTAALFGTVPAAVLGGVGTIAIALLWMKLFPTLRHIEKLE